MSDAGIGAYPSAEIETDHQNRVRQGADLLTGRGFSPNRTLG